MQNVKRKLIYIATGMWRLERQFAELHRGIFYHHHISVMELGHLLTRSGLMYLEVSSKVCHDSFCQLGNLLRGILFTCCIQFLLYSSNLSKTGVIPLQFVHLFCNQSKCILLFFFILPRNNTSNMHGSE